MLLMYKVEYAVVQVKDVGVWLQLATCFLLLCLLYRMSVL